MLIIFFRAIILYIALLIVMRLMGKRQIGEMQPFEFVITLLIAELACIPMSDISIPISYGIVSILAVFILHQIMSLLERSGRFVKFLISGKPSIVINPDGVDIKELKKNNMNVADLAEAMRAQGYFSFDELNYAIFESNGKLSTMENNCYEEINSENGKNKIIDDNCKSGKSKENSEEKKTKTLSFIVVSNGKINKNNLFILDLSMENLNFLLEKNKLKIKDVEVMTIDKNYKVYLKIKNTKYRVFNFKIKNGEILW